MPASAGSSGAGSDRPGDAASEEGEVAQAPGSRPALRIAHAASQGGRAHPTRRARRRSTVRTEILRLSQNGLSQNGYGGIPNNSYIALYIISPSS